MTAGRLAKEGKDVPKGMVLIAPGSVIKEGPQFSVSVFIQTEASTYPESSSAVVGNGSHCRLRNTVFKADILSIVACCP